MDIIVAVLTAVGKAISSKNGEAPKKEKVIEAPVVSAPQPVVEEGIPEHVRVAIIAAIAAYYEQGNAQPNHEFKVRKIKKLNR